MSRFAIDLLELASDALKIDNDIFDLDTRSTLITEYLWRFACNAFEANIGILDGNSKNYFLIRLPVLNPL